tara:strand:- start:79 stop:588 length:510 start_codon:yes stop_codon:yes gene_type:complete
MKKLLGIIFLSFFLSGSLYAKDKPKYFSCENSFGIHKVYLKYHFTDKTKYDVITKKFVKDSKKKIPTLELHKEANFETKNYNKLLTLYISDKYYYFSRIENPSFYSSSDERTIDFILNRYDLSGRKIDHKGMLHPSRKSKINDEMIDEILTSNEVRVVQCKEIEFKQQI